jgi:hypothetical protein
MKTEATGATSESTPGFDASLDAPHERLRRCGVVIGREQQGHLYRHSRGDALFNRRQPPLGEERRDFERDPPVEAVGAVVDRAEEVGGAPQVLERQLEERFFAGSFPPRPCRGMASS